MKQTGPGKRRASHPTGDRPEGDAGRGHAWRSECGTGEGAGLDALEGPKSSRRKSRPIR